MNLDSFRSMQWVDYLMYALTDPGALYRLLQRKKESAQLAVSFLVPVTVLFLDIIASSLLRTETDFFYTKLTYGWLLSIFITLFTVTAAASLMDGFAQILGYRGNMKEMVVLVNFSQMPKALLLPGMLIFRTLHFAAPFFYVFLSFLFVIWSAFIAVKGIAEMHDCGPGRALLIYLFPFLFAGITAFFVLVVSALYLARYLS